MYEEYLLDILNVYITSDFRSYSTNKRGKIALIKSKTNIIYGFVDLVSIDQISYEDYGYWHIGKLPTYGNEKTR